jgi:hypothetical protein
VPLSNFIKKAKETKMIDKEILDRTVENIFKEFKIFL